MAEELPKITIIDKDGQDTGAVLETKIPIDNPSTVDAAARALGSIVTPPPAETPPPANS